MSKLARLSVHASKETVCKAFCPFVTDKDRLPILLQVCPDLNRYCSAFCWENCFTPMCWR